MLAELDLLLTTVFCPADDLLPERAKHARRRFGLRDAERVPSAGARASAVRFRAADYGRRAR